MQNFSCKLTPTGSILHGERFSQVHSHQCSLFTSFTYAQGGSGFTFLSRNTSSGQARSLPSLPVRIPHQGDRKDQVPHERVSMRVRLPLKVHTWSRYLPRSRTVNECQSERGRTQEHSEHIPDRAIVATHGLDRLASTWLMKHTRAEASLPSRTPPN